MEVVNYFDENAPILAHSALSKERTERELDFVVDRLALTPPMSILDVGCGFGRHTIGLAQRGFAVTGIDPSSVMLARACALAGETAVSPQFIEATGEQFRSDHRFDAAICLFNTLGQLSLKGDNRGLIANVAQLLKPSGRFVVEVPNWETAVSDLIIDETYGEGDDAPKVNRQYYEDSGLILEVFRIWVREKRRVFLLKYQLFRQEELVQLFEAAGLRVDNICGDYNGQPYTPQSKRVIVLGTVI
jgi:2-polyprenyl-3-methyl-5-hydroxy-6-metoxy-1,4-benzoquinol methylase